MKKIKKLILSLIISASTCAILNSVQVQVNAQNDPEIAQLIQTYDFEKIKNALNVPKMTTEDLINAFTKDDFTKLIFNRYPIHDPEAREYLVALLNEANHSNYKSTIINDARLFIILRKALTNGNFTKSDLFMDLDLLDQIDREELLRLIITEYPQTFRNLIGGDLKTFERRLKYGNYIPDDKNFSWRGIDHRLFLHPPTITDIQQNSLKSRSLWCDENEVVGDCYFLTALQALIADNFDINKIITDNGDGTVTVTFYDPDTNQRKSYTIEKSVPTDHYNPSNAPWVRLLEKAYAVFVSESQRVKINEAGSAIYTILGTGGDPTIAVHNLTGREYGSGNQWLKPDQATKNSAEWAPQKGLYSAKVLEYLSSALVIANVQRSLLFTDFNLPAKKLVNLGLSPGHSYYISGINCKENIPGHKTWFVEMYNPAGKGGVDLPRYKDNGNGGYTLSKGPSLNGKFVLELNDFIRLSRGIEYLTNSQDNGTLPLVNSFNHFIAEYQAIQNKRISEALRTSERRALCRNCARRIFYPEYLRMGNGFEKMFKIMEAFEIGYQRAIQDLQQAFNF